MTVRAGPRDPWIARAHGCKYIPHSRWWPDAQISSGIHHIHFKPTSSTSVCRVNDTLPVETVDTSLTFIIIERTRTDLMLPRVLWRSPGSLLWADPWATKNGRYMKRRDRLDIIANAWSIYQQSTPILGEEKRSGPRARRRHNTRNGIQQAGPRTDKRKSDDGEKS